MHKTRFEYSATYISRHCDGYVFQDCKGNTIVCRYDGAFEPVTGTSYLLVSNMPVVSGELNYIVEVS